MRILVPRAPEEISPWTCLCSAGHSVGFPCWCHSMCHSITPTRRIVSRETLNSPLYQFTCHEVYYSGRAPYAICYPIASHLSAQGLEPPARRLLLPHRRAGPRDCANWGSVPESCGTLVQQQGRGRRNRMESAAVLIRSPCDVFIACLGCRQGQVTIGLVLVNGGGCTSTSGGGWHSCGDFFLSFCWGWGEERRGVQTIPSYLPLLNRHHGRAGTWSTCIDTSYNGRDPVTNEPDLGLWDGKTGLDRLDR